MNKTDQDIVTALKFKKIAVVGLSPDQSRPSYGVSEYMKSCGYEITPVRPGSDIILGVPSVESLSKLSKPIEIVNVFRRPEFVEAITDEAIAVGAKVLWLQEGVYHPVAEENARKAGLIVISDRCILKEHMRFAEMLDDQEI